MLQRAERQRAVTKLNRVIRQHGPVAKTLHWGFIAVFLYGLSKQLDELEELADPALLHDEMIFGAFFLLLLVARFWYMRTNSPSALPDTAPRQMKTASQAVHLGMYCCLAMIPLTGLGIGGLYWSGVQSGTLMAGLLLAHEVFVHASFFLISGHIAAALYHRKHRDGIWDSMVPLFRAPAK